MWVTYSLRKTTLKRRVMDLNSRLMRISSQLQSQQRTGSYKLQMIQSNKNQVLSDLESKYNEQYQYYSNQAQNSSDTKTQNNINSQLTELQQAYNSNKEYYESYFTRLEEQQTSENERKESALTMEQEQVQTQAEAAKAEYDTLKEACSQGIKDDAYKLA